MDSLIPADHFFAVLAALFAIAAFGFWAETKTWGKLMTGAVWAILGGIVLSNLKVIPQASAAYDLVFRYFVPLLLPLFLMHADIRRILAESGRVGLAFILACSGTVIGVVAGASMVDLGPDEAILSGMFTATYTGGSANFAAMIQATGFDDASAISAATAVDNLLGISFLALIILMPASRYLTERYRQRDFTGTHSAEGNQQETGVSALSLAAALTFALTVVALADSTVFLLSAFWPELNSGSLRYLFITFYSVLPASLMPTRMSKLHGGQSLGLVLALVFFATIAAGADIAALLTYAPVLVLFVSMILLVHWLVVFIGGMLLSLLFERINKPYLSLSLPELIIASNAAVLGATTAPALAMARGWGKLITPGILVGVAGYIIGTPLGLLIYRWW